MSHQPFSEKRRHPRVDNSIPVKICSPDADLVTETKNISCSGAYCRVNKYIEPMTKLRITLLLPVRKGNKLSTKKICCDGVVVRTENALKEDGFYTAIFFSDIHQRDSRILSEFVNGAIAGSQEAAA